MTNALNQRVQVTNDEVAGPYLPVTLDQLPRIREILDQHEVYYWVDSTAISIGARPAVTVVNFGRRGDANQIQAIFDEAD